MTAKKTDPLVNRSGPSLVLTRIFNAPRALVFAAWTQPMHMKSWAAPHGFSITDSTGEIRTGGHWRSCMVTPNGEKLWLKGVYREVRPIEFLSFTHIWEEDDGTPEHETLVTIQFEDLGDKTKMTFTQQFFASEESRNGHEGGWSQCFEKLDAHLAALK